MNRPVRDPYAGWCERRTSSEKSGEAVYSIISCPSVRLNCCRVKFALNYCLVLVRWLALSFVFFRVAGAMKKTNVSANV